ncbi:type II secretion system minor pseudopilin GspI [Aquipseudomonas alcaligenes]
MAWKRCALKRCEGFTLLEVMVALAIFATLSVALYSAAGHIAGNNAGLTERSLAQWLADNRLNELRAGMREPQRGYRKERIAFAGRQWLLGTEISAAPDPRLLEVKVDVAVPNDPPLTRALLSGFIEAPR